MYAPTGKRKVALPLLLAISIAVSGLGNLALADRCTDAPNDASCAASKCSCSEQSDESRACCCAAKKAPTPQRQNSGVITSPLDLKLASWVQGAFLAPTATEDCGLLPTWEGRFFSPGGPSIQLRLCIWRI